MSRRTSPQQWMVLVIAVVAAATFLPSLTGCEGRESPLRAAINVLSNPSYHLDAEAEGELARLRAVYAGLVTQVDQRDLEHFEDAFKRLRVSYVHPIDDRVLIGEAVKAMDDLALEPGSGQSAVVIEAALDGMMGSLDPHSAYLNAQEYRDTTISTKGEFGGLGIQVSMDKDAVLVIAPIEDTPAFRAGVEAGDRIIGIDGEAVKGMSLTQAIRKMRGKPGTEIRLTIERKEVPDFDVTIVRDIIRVKSVRWRKEGDIGYLRVVSFTEKVEEGVSNAMAALQAELGPAMKGVVLDLRGNPGGLLDQSLELADAFLDHGDIVSVRYRDKARDRVYVADSGDLARDLPMVVLVNGGSASASEIVASALQAHRRAIVMGRQTFGKGSVQTISPLPKEGALRMTTALYYSPSGDTIQALGVEPDIILDEEKAAPSEETEAVERGPRRESELTGALPAGVKYDHEVRARLQAKACPAVGEGEQVDHELGCALAYLRAGSAAAFLASIKAGAAM